MSPSWPPLEHNIIGFLALHFIIFTDDIKKLDLKLPKTDRKTGEATQKPSEDGKDSK